MWINGEKDTGKLVEFPSFAGILLWKTQWKVFITVCICLFSRCLIFYFTFLQENCIIFLLKFLYGEINTYKSDSM